MKTTTKSITYIGCTVFLASLMSACSGGGDSYSASQDIVTVTGGQVAATSDSTETRRVFKAIPFAAPPVGNLRWKAPQPVAAWSGVRQNDNFSNACVMGNRPAGLPGAILYQPAPAQSEDCLYLNVWTGASNSVGSTKRPVMLLLHGGGYLLGSGAQANYDGTGLAAKGAVVVTLNYRLGALGFMAHPELTTESANHASGNYALMDAIAALQWVKTNIAAFGGDPANVTLYSESAGAGLASVLLASPPAAGLFHRMVTESLAALPSTTANPTLAQAEASGAALGTTLGATTLAAMRAKSAADVMAAAGALVGPIVDGYVLPDQLDLLLKRGAVNDVPLLAGWNADEGTPYPPFATTLAAYNTTAAARYGALATDFKATYPVASDADVLAMAYAPMRDSLFAWQPWTLARAHARLGKSKTFLYFFNRRPNYFAGQKFTELDPPSRYGAYHSLEQVYFYNNLARSVPTRDYNATDAAIADAASTYLVNFARNGDPNGTGVATWPAFTSAASQTMLIGDEIKAGDVPFRPALDFFERFYTQALGRAPF
jgi:para-nitrobenzyl esterase